MSRSRGTYMTGRLGRPPRNPLFLAAEFLRDVSQRYLKDKANESELDEAVSIWLEARDAQHDALIEAEEREANEVLTGATQKRVYEIMSGRAQIALNSLSAQDRISVLTTVRLLKLGQVDKLKKLGMPRHTKLRGWFATEDLVLLTSGGDAHLNVEDIMSTVRLDSIRKG